MGYLCLVPMIAITSGTGFKKGFRSGYLFGVLQGAILLYWVGVGIRSYAASAELESVFVEIFLNYIAPIGAPIALSLIHALFLAVAFGVYGWISKGGNGYIFAFPFVWISVEYIRTLSEFAFPWVQLAYTQSMYVPMIQTASLWGDLGVGFWIALINVLLYLAWKYRKSAGLAIGFVVVVLILIGANLIYGSTVRYEPEGEKIDVALIQGNITLPEKFSDGSLVLSLNRHMEMVEPLKKDSVDFIIFAETTIREFLMRRGSAWPPLASIAREKDAHLLVGTFDAERRDDRFCAYNSAVQIEPNGMMKYVHHKIRLVPFSEKIPYNQYFPFINEFHFGQSDFCMGDSLPIFDIGYGKYAVMICFEVGFSDLNRKAVEKGANFMVTITNDTWWGISAGPYQHAYMVPYRAVENRRWYARCANSGFSFFCDPTGRIADLGELFEKMVIKGDIYPIEKKTFFTRHGLWMPKLILLFTFLLILNRIIIKIVKRIR
ncbi:MAG: apolipoprotein N-acyltransferase [candidate division Zixibacteria bacterium]|nr:apolipoprotein N-acyltransferase [candidate division Zixibacteria bacterium]NIW40764.1 apolipoprotein N-acyltransferase [candidate division Zixibacteria bacterium]NIX79556.1 apolipoprotein N-acyltransferase [candidate division Zixibacteria bacterium]